MIINILVIVFALYFIWKGRKPSKDNLEEKISSLIDEIRQERKQVNRVRTIGRVNRRRR